VINTGMHVPSSTNVSASPNGLLVRKLQQSQLGLGTFNVAGTGSIDDAANFLQNAVERFR
jgi:hypothetical protein